MSEVLTNESDVALRAMWGHHITFGRPFLTPGCRIRLPEGVTAIPHPVSLHSEGRRVSGDGPFGWPVVPGVDGGEVDLGLLPPPGTAGELVYLTRFREGWYEVESPAHGIGCRVGWDAGTMPYLWFWQEFGAARGYPWYGRHYNIGLEPFSSYPTNGLAEAVENGTALSIGPREERRFDLTTEVFGVGEA